MAQQTRSTEFAVPAPRVASSRALLDPTGVRREVARGPEMLRLLDIGSSAPSRFWSSLLVVSGTAAGAVLGARRAGRRRTR